MSDLDDLMAAFNAADARANDSSLTAQERADAAADATAFATALQQTGGAQEPALPETVGDIAPQFGTGGEGVLAGLTYGMYPAVKQQKPPAGYMAEQLGYQATDTPHQIGEQFLALPEEHAGLNRDYSKEKAAQHIAQDYFEDLAGRRLDPVEVIPPEQSQVGRWMYVDPRNGKPTFFDELGLDTAEAERLGIGIGAGTAADVSAVTALEIGKRVAPVPGPGLGKKIYDIVLSPALVGAAADATAAAGLREYELNELRDRGVLPEAFDADGEVTDEFVSSVIGSMAGEYGIRLGMNWLKDESMRAVAKTMDLDPDVMETLIKRYYATYGDKAHEAGIEPTAAEMMKAVAKTDKEIAVAEIAMQQKKYLENKNDLTVMFQERAIANERHAADVLNTYSEITDVIPDAARVTAPDEFGQIIPEPEYITTGTRVNEFLNDRAEAFSQQYTEPVAQAVQNAAQAADAALGPARSPFESMQPFYDTVTKAQETFLEESDRVYRGLEERAGNDRVFDPAPIREAVHQFGMDAAARVDAAEAIMGDPATARAATTTNLVQAGAGRETAAISAAEAEQAAAYQAVLEMSGLDDGLLNSLLSTDVPDSALRNVSYSELKNALKDLRSRLYEIPESNRQARRIAGNLVEVMESTLYNQSRANFGDDFADELIGADEAFHNGSRVLTENLNAKLKDSYIPGLVLDGVRQPPTFKDGTFDNLFKGDKGLETLWAMRNMRDVKFLEGHEDIFNNLHGLDRAVKEGLWSKFRDSVLVESSPGSGTMIVDPKRLEAFRGRYNAILTRSGLFTPEELRRMDTAAGLQQVLRSTESEMKALKKSLKGKSYPWGSDAAAGDVPSLFKKTFGMDKFEQSAKLAKVLRESGSEDLIKDYRRMIARDMFDGKDGFIRNGLIDPTQMDKYLTKNGRLLDLWFGDPSNPQMGKQLMTALRQAQRIVDAVVDNAGPMAPPGADFSLTAANDLLRGFFGTISAKGKALTAFLKLQRRANDNELVNFMMNPQQFIDSEDFLRRFADPTYAGTIMRQADELIDSWYDDDELTREFINDQVEWFKSR